MPRRRSLTARMSGRLTTPSALSCSFAEEGKWKQEPEQRRSEKDWGTHSPPSVAAAKPGGRPEPPADRSRMLSALLAAKKRSIGAKLSPKVL